MCRTCLIAAFAALLPVTAGADLAGWYLSGGMSFISSDSERSNDDDFAPYIGVGRTFGDRYSLDVEYNDYSFDLGAAGDVDIDGFNLTGRYYLLGNDNTSPYVGLGVGSLDSDGPFGEGSDPHFDVAGGVHWLIGDRWGLRGEVRRRFDGDNDTLPPADDFEDLMLSLGLTFALSPRVQPAPPRQSEPEPEPEPVPNTTFILLPDEDGSVGRVVVSTNAGQEELSQAGYGVEVANAQAAPGKPTKANQAEVDRVFAPAQSIFPEAPMHYQVYFQFDSAELTAASKQQISEIVAAIEAHNSVEIGVVGHSDSAGKMAYNLTLSERRAEAIARLLVEMGVRKDLVVSTSLGEDDPAIPTADNVKEPRNRRVEITIR